MQEQLTVHRDGIILGSHRIPVELNDKGFLARLPPREPDMVREEVLTVLFSGGSGKHGFKARIDFRMRPEALLTPTPTAL